MKLSLIVPCYNESGNVRLFAKEAREHLAGYDYEIVFINDGSRDDTYASLEELCAQSSDNLTVLNFTRNFGKESALYAGLENAKGDYIAFVDADLQQPLQTVREMVDFLEEHSEYDVVAAYQAERKEGRGVAWLKKKFYGIISRMSEIELRENASDFRVMRRNVAQALLGMPEYFRFTKGLFSWVGYATYYRPYEVQQRNSGKSSWSTKKLFRYAIEGMISFSTKPLKAAVGLGLFTSGAAILYMLVVVIKKLCVGEPVPGYPTLVALILLLGGVQLTVLGIIGEYLARIHIEVKHRPIYLVRQRLESTKKEPRN